MRKKGLRIKEVAQATSIPMSTLSEWTSGRIPRLDVDIVRLARFLGVSLEELVLGNAEINEGNHAAPAVFEGHLKVTVSRIKEEPDG